MKLNARNDDRKLRSMAEVEIGKELGIDHGSREGRSDTGARRQQTTNFKPRGNDTMHH